MESAVNLLETRLSNLKISKSSNVAMHGQLKQDAEEYLLAAEKNEEEIVEIEAALIKLKEGL